MIIQFSNHLDLSYFFSVTLPTPSMLRSKERRGGFHNCLFHPLTSQFHLFFPFFSFLEKKKKKVRDRKEDQQDRVYNSHRRQGALGNHLPAGLPMATFSQMPQLSTRFGCSIDNILVWGERKMREGRGKRREKEEEWKKKGRRKRSKQIGKCRGGKKQKKEGLKWNKWSQPSLHAYNKPGTVHLPYLFHFIFRTKQVL